MNYYEARETKNHKGWHFTCMNDGVIWPVGYCKFHGPHPTREEAEECYAKYLLDTKLSFRKLENQMLRCRKCDEFTDGIAECDCTIIPLCEKHSNRETFEELWTSPTQIMSSW